MALHAIILKDRTAQIHGKGLHALRNAVFNIVFDDITIFNRRRVIGRGPQLCRIPDGNL